jgi:hypothetical protein
MKDHHFITINREILPIVQEKGSTFATEDVISLMGQLDIEIDRQSSFMTAFKNN